MRDVWISVVGAVLFLVAWFGVAFAAERVAAFGRLARHPAVYALSLGVFATSWTFSGGVGFAFHHGIAYAATSVGFSLACFGAPFLFAPLLRVVRSHGAASLADLFAFRYASQRVGVLVTLLSLASSAPYLAVQVKSVADGIAAALHVAPLLPGAAFAVVVTLFTVWFGVRDASTQVKHPGLALAVALESVLKAAALALVAVVAFVSLRRADPRADVLRVAFPDGAAGAASPSWTTIVVLSFMAAFLLPRQFHMAFVEAPRAPLAAWRATRWATWATPLLLLVMAVAVPFIVAAGRTLLPGEEPDQMVAGVARGSPVVATAAFLGNVAAASSMVAVTALACGTMVLHHLVLPLSALSYRIVGHGRKDPYRGVLLARRASVAFVVVLGFASFLVLENAHGLVEIGLVAFVGSAQLAPGLVGGLAWRGASRFGVAVGICLGSLVWLVLLVLPMTAAVAGLALPWSPVRLLGFDDVDPWTPATACSLALNTLGLVVGSLFRPPDAVERDAAAACFEDALRERPTGAAVEVEELERRLAAPFGQDLARRELASATADEGLAHVALSAVEASRVRDRLEGRLSGLFGPLRARAALDAAFAVEIASGPEAALRALDEALLRTRAHAGPLAQIEAVRSWLRRVVDELPVGVVALGERGDVVLWNRAMGAITGLPEADVVGRTLERLPEPWGHALAEGEPTRLVGASGERRTLHLRRGAREGPLRLLVVEDQTAQRRLEEHVAHQDRLGALGRLVAGVGHEIGNPLTALLLVLERIRAMDGVGDRSAETRAAVEEALQLGKRIRVILGDLRGYGRLSGEVVLQPVDLAQSVDDAVRLLSLVGRDVEVVRAVAPGLRVRAEGTRLTQIVLNLLANAVDASPAGSVVEIHAGVVDEAGQRRVQLEVRDDGMGIDPEVLPHVFEPFVTTKQPGEGTGLGLWVVWEFVGHMGGEISVDSAPGRGTVFTVKLPLASDQEGTYASPKEPRP